jgi:hypothetical protein
MANAKIWPERRYELEYDVATSLYRWVQEEGTDSHLRDTSELLPS